MAGSALSRLWATNPKLACFFQSAICVTVAALIVAFVLQDTKNWTLIVVLTLFEVIEGRTLVWFTRDAIQDGWARRE